MEWRDSQMDPQSQPESQALSQAGSSPLDKRQSAESQGPSLPTRATDDATTCRQTIPAPLTLRYQECLWMGEAFFPLAEFPLVMDAALEESGARGCMVDIARLLTSRDNLQRKYREVLPVRIASLASSHCGGENFSDGADGADGEDAAIHAALQSGPGLHVKRSLIRAVSGDERHPSSPPPPSRLRDEWLNAIERRELCLQILLVLQALRLTVEYPEVVGVIGADLAASLSVRKGKGVDAGVVVDAAQSSTLPEKVSMQSADLRPNSALASSSALAESMPESQMVQDSNGIVPAPESQTQQETTAGEATSMLESQSSAPSAPLLESQSSDAPALRLESQSTTHAPMLESQSPALPAPMLESQSQSSPPVPSTRDRKRKRKSLPARRWTGFPTGLDGDVGGVGFFPWAKKKQQQQQQNASGSASTSSQADDPTAPSSDDAIGPLIVCDADKMHKRFESLADRLLLRVVTADLASDVAGLLDDGVGGGESKTPSQKQRSQRSRPVFGTAAARRRLRGDDDDDDGDGAGKDADDLHYLYASIVEPHFSRTLPRQCSVLMSHAVTGVGSTTPARNRPKAAKSSSANTVVATSTTTSSPDHRLAQTRKELDLMAKGKQAQIKAKARQERRASQRPALRDALFAEEAQQRKGRSSSIAADAERNKREVSVKRRVGWARSASTSQAAVGGSEGENSQSQGDTFSHSQASLAPPPPPPRRVFGRAESAMAVTMPFNKRKTLEPQRFGGLAGRQQQQQSQPLPQPPPRRTSANNPTALEDNPFIDSVSARSQPQHTAPPRPNMSSSSSSRLMVAETPPRKTKRIRPQLISPPSTQLQHATTSASASASARSTPWSRTESQPAAGASRDSASISAAGNSELARPPSHPQQQRRVSPMGARPVNPFHPPASNSRLAVPTNRAPFSRSSSRATSLTPSDIDAVADAGVDVNPDQVDAMDDDDDDEDAASSCSSLDSLGVGAAQQTGGDDKEVEEEEEMFVYRPPPRKVPSHGDVERRPLHGLSGIGNWVKGSSGGAAGGAVGIFGNRLPASRSEADVVVKAGITRASSTTAASHLPPPQPPPLVRRPSGRNPFAKSASMQQIRFSGGE